MRCPHCQNNDLRLLEQLGEHTWRCDVCSKPFERATPKTRVTVGRTGHDILRDIELDKARAFDAETRRRFDGPPFDTLEEKRGER